MPSSPFRRRSPLADLECAALLLLAAPGIAAAATPAPLQQTGDSTGTAGSSNTTSGAAGASNTSTAGAPQQMPVTGADGGTLSALIAVLGVAAGRGWVALRKR